MDDPLSRGLPFELADIWRRSSLQVKTNGESLFAPLDASFPPLDPGNDTLDHENDLVIPPLNGEDDVGSTQPLQPPESDIASPPIELWDTSQSRSDDNASVWDLGLDLCLPPEKPLIQTWEAFEKTKNAAAAERTAYLSEAGTKAFDAALARPGGKSNGVLPQDVMLRALCNLAVGRGSVFFQWDEPKACFDRTLENVPISGYSATACDSFILQMMDYATSYRSLRASCTGVLPRKLALPCAVAFYGCAGGVLDAIEELITRELSQVRSILQLQTLIAKPRGMLSTLKELFCLVKKAKTDEDIISALSDRVHEVVSADGAIAGILRIVLQRTSAPWLEKLAVDIGLAENLATATADVTNEDEGSDMSELDTSSHPARIAVQSSPGVLSTEDRAMILDTKASLRILRTSAAHRFSHDDHPQWFFRDAVRESDGAALGVDGLRSLAAPLSSDTSLSKHSLEEERAWATDDIQLDYLVHLDLRISRPPQPAILQTDPLASAVHSYCNSIPQISTPTPTLTILTNPLDSLRPALRAQNNHLNRTLLRHLITSNLNHHLHLQHAYQHLTSGEFSTRLCTALFSIGDETQSAERRRGAIPTGQKMGLRLSGGAGEKRWPPASSELRLTLADVLTETYTADFPVLAEQRRQGIKELPGSLSFSIRELPEHEIERVMDASSLYALDFLRLQYTAPAPLDAVITARAIEMYDQIFRQSLRFLRVLHVTSQLRRDVGRRQGTVKDGEKAAAAGTDAGRAQFAHHAHHTTTTLYTHFMGLGIVSPWQPFIRALSSFESGLHNKDDEPVISIQALRQMHLACLDKIRARLFLRRKQEKLRIAVEGVLSGILAGLVGSEGDALRVLGEKVEDLVGVLRKEVERPPKTNITNANDDDDEKEVLRMLLVRLDWNRFYSQHTPGT